MGTTNMPEDESNELQCCICKATVERGKNSQLDPCGLVLTANFDSPRPEQKEQTLHCHFSVGPSWIQMIGSISLSRTFQPSEKLMVRASHGRPNRLVPRDVRPIERMN